MFFNKNSPRINLVIAILLLSFAALTISPAFAGTAGKDAARPSFAQLVKKLKKTTSRMVSFMFSREQVKARPKIAVKAVLKGDASTTVAAGVTGAVPAAPAPPATPATPMPGDAARIPVSASGRLSADVPGSGKKTFEANEAPVVGYSQGTYYLVQDGQTVAASKQPIKLSPEAGAILNLPDFKDANWNNTVNLNAFRGSVEVVYSEKSRQLWAVNELGVEDYLRGMAEASHESPDEHLKVMAIVARSYIVHHLAGGGRHPGEPFHLKNSRNGNGDDQVYRGYTAEQRQPRIAKAAGDTAGTVVTYQGKPVITPYSTRADGRTRSPAEAGWKVDWPWVQSVPDPDTAGMSKLGHGVGLSGLGSRKRAERGNTAAQILGYYFPGTSLGQVNTAAQTVRIAIYAQPL